MKKYKKQTTKLFQARLQEEEYKILIAFIRDLKITRREFLITSIKLYENHIS